MSPQNLVVHFIASLLLACSTVAVAKPDIVIFIADDYSKLDLAPYGSREMRTPNMQRLADAGMTFTRACVPSPSCAPSRAALLTGLMPSRNGAEPNHSNPRPELKKWPAYFCELGYEVVAFGKVSHYRHTADYGFDRFAHDTFHDHAGIPAAVEFLKNRPRSGAKPLCLFVGSNWPHVPWPETPPESDLRLPLPAGSIDTPATRRWRARYAAAVARADDELGLIYDAARAHLGETTLFLFTSDHGAQWPFAKWNCYEAGVNVPLIVAWPGVIKPGTRTDAMVSWVDLLPTLLEAAGCKAPADIDGRSFLSVLKGRKRSHRDRIFTTHSGDGRWNVYPIRSVRTADSWKYIRNLHPEFAFTTHIDLPGNLGQRAYFVSWENAAKTNAAAAEVLKRYHARPSEELYDLNTDPHEQRNLANTPKQASRLKSLRRELDQWMQEQGDRQIVSAEPRLLADSKSFGPNATSGNAAARDRSNEVGWIHLFNGTNTAGWMNSDGSPPRTPVEDGSLNPHKAGGYMLVHTQQWENFRLELDFKISPGCNSGIFVRTASLAPRPGKDIGFNGIEIAIDDTTGAGYHDPGAIYDLVKPARNAMKPAGEWNHIAITCDETRIEVVLNGEPVTRADLAQFVEPYMRPDGTRHKFDVAYKDHPQRGYIGLQDHGKPCWFRNIRVKPIP